MPQQDWFAANAPKQNPKQAGDWFADNAPSATSTMRATPKFGSERYIKSNLYAGADYLTNLLPDIGGTVGAIAGAGAGLEGGPAAVASGVAGAAAGGAAGEFARDVARKKLFGEGPSSGIEAVRDVATAAGEQGAYELAGQVGGRVLKRVTQSAPGVIPLTMAERTGNKPSGFMEHLSERSIPGANTFAEFRKRQTQAVVDYVNRVVTQLSSFRGTPEEGGKLIQDALDSARTAMKQDESEAYRALDEMTKSKTVRVPQSEQRVSSLVDEHGQPMTYEKTVLRKVEQGGVQPSTLPLRKNAVRLLREIQREKQLIPPQLLGDSESILQRIVNSPRNVPFETMQRGRSDLLAIARKLDDVLPGRRAGIAKLMSRDIDQAMADAAEKAGPDVLAQLRKAQAITRDMHQLYEQKLVTRILETARPEDVAEMVKKAGLEDLRTYNRLVPAAQRGAVSGKILQDVLEDALKTGDTIRGDRFANALSKLGDERGQLIFGNQFQAIRQLQTTVARIHVPAEQWLPALHNYMYIGAATAGLPAALLGRPEALAYAVGDAAFMKGIAKVMTHPDGVAKLGRFMAAVAHQSPRAMDASARALTTYMRQGDQKESQEGAR